MSCSSGRFKGSYMIERVVGNLHALTPDDEAVAYASRRLKRGVWERFSDAERKSFECEVQRVHRRNLKLYLDVMRGGF